MAEKTLLQDPEFQQALEQLIAEKLEAFVRQNELRARELALMERVVRVEEELKALRKIEEARFEAMEKRFEALQREMNARFEAVDRHFEAMDKRLSMMQWVMGVGFTVITVLITLSNFLLR